MLNFRLIGHIVGHHTAFSHRDDPQKQEEVQITATDCAKLYYFVL